MNDAFDTIGDVQLLTQTRALAGKSSDCEADLLLHLGEVEARKLYLEDARPSLFAWCVDKLNFSENVTCNRIAVARLGRRFPVVIEYLRSGRIHLTGLKLLEKHLTEQNCARLLEAAVHKSRVQIEALCAKEHPKPRVPDSMRKLPSPSASVVVPAVASLPMDSSNVPMADVAVPSVPPVSTRPAHKPIQPLAEDAFLVKFTASRNLRDKLKKLQDMMSHAVPNRDLATLLEKAVDLLIEKVEKRRCGAKSSRARPKPTTQDTQATPPTRHIPAAIKRQVWDRDENQCTFRSAQGERCPETAHLQLDHLDGWSRTHQHSVDRIVLKCRAHNLHAAEQMYGAEWMRSMTQRAPSREGYQSPLPLASGD